MNVSDTSLFRYVNAVYTYSLGGSNLGSQH